MHVHTLYIHQTSAIQAWNPGEAQWPSGPGYQAQNSQKCFLQKYRLEFTMYSYVVAYVERYCRLLIDIERYCRL